MSICADHGSMLLRARSALAGPVTSAVAQDRIDHGNPGKVSWMAGALSSLGLPVRASHQISTTRLPRLASPARRTPG
jgi:hypothetical protein